MNSKVSFKETSQLTAR